MNTAEPIAADISPGALAVLDEAGRDFVLTQGNGLTRLQALKAAAAKVAPWVQTNFITKRDAFDALYDLAETRGLMAELGETTISTAIMVTLDEPAPELQNGAAKTSCLASARIDYVETENANNSSDFGSSDGEIPDLKNGAVFGPDVPPHGEPVARTAPGPVELVTAADWPDEVPPSVAWVVRDKIPRGDVSTLDGDGGLGKTMAAMQLAAAVARGLPDWLGMEVVEQGPVVFLSAEEPEAEIHRRAFRIAARGRFALSDLAGLHFWFPPDVGDCLLAIQTSGTIQGTPLFRSIAERITDMRPALVVVDNVAAIYGGNQNDRAAVRTFMNLWRGLARASGAAVLLLNHPSLSGLTAGTGRGGSMDWRNAVRAGLHLKPSDDRAEADRGVRILECVKNNYAAQGSPVRLEWVDGILTPEGTASPLQRAAQDAQADEKFLELLARHIRLGIDLSPSTGHGYAPKVFADAPDNGGYTNRGFATVMHRLLTKGQIIVEELGPPSKRRKRLVIASDGRD